MKQFVAIFLFTLSAMAQAPAPAPVPPPPETLLKPDTVVARVGSRKLTVTDMNEILAKLPPDLQQALMRNPKQSLQSLFVLDQVSAEGEKNNLADNSPYKEQLAFQRKQVLAQAQVAFYQQQAPVTEDDAKKSYDSDPARFGTAKLRAIFVAYADPKTAASKPAEGQTPQKTLTEDEAKSKAEDLAKQARGGADFAELARKNSDDKPTAEKGGDFGTIRRNEKLVESIKQAVFAQKPGGITDPVKFNDVTRQRNGFYVIKVEELGQQKYEEVHDQIVATLKQEKFQQYIQGINKQYEAAIEAPEFFKLMPAATPMAK